MLYLFVFLKLPVIALCWLLWWAIKQEPGYEDSDGGGGGRRRPHPVPKLPHAPRRGPHRDPAPPSPARVRTVSVRAREPRT
jgi:hypothetical protein